jgi:hypothetical protein
LRPSTAPDGEQSLGFKDPQRFHASTSTDPELLQQGL